MAHLRQGFASSRSGTPDAPSLCATPPRSAKGESLSPNSKLGVKRKVETDSADGQPDGLLPLRKVILALA
jgi:hypothetical protein